MVGWLSIAGTNINYDRFKKNIDRVGGEGTAEFVREAISIYCDK
ncbi:TipAS antibiotic-recognition domain-containing protein [Mogibacterium sp.]|nr:TipAS antibiotic-recognition domain-containing protein [Mogibacterium sp.]MBN2936218.1 TipAS antibiotic-recognition domain-containing protein [Mogibacterium sp.]